MTLNDLLLEKLANWRPAAKERATLAVTDEKSGCMAALTADRCDDLSCLVWELTIRRPRTDGTPPLTDRARLLAEHVTGLLEPLKVVEVDAARDEAILRSDEPTYRSDDLFYYELRLKGNEEATLRRFQGATPTGRRQQISFALTHEALAKIAQDLTAEK
ncbi:MAG: hypothetical protein ACK4RK_20920 [Gemmataceae bacterium]